MRNKLLELKMKIKNYLFKKSCILDYITIQHHPLSGPQYIILHYKNNTYSFHEISKNLRLRINK